MLAYDLIIIFSLRVIWLRFYIRSTSINLEMYQSILMTNLGSFIDIFLVKVSKSETRVLPFLPRSLFFRTSVASLSLWPFSMVIRGRLKLAQVLRSVLFEKCATSTKKVRRQLYSWLKRAAREKETGYKLKRWSPAAEERNTTEGKIFLFRSLV